MSNEQRDRRQTSRARLALRALWETVKEIGAAALLLVIAGWVFWLPLLLIADKVMQSDPRDLWRENSELLLLWAVSATLALGFRISSEMQQRERPQLRCRTCGEAVLYRERRGGVEGWRCAVCDDAWQPEQSGSFMGFVVLLVFVMPFVILLLVILGWV